MEANPVAADASPDAGKHGGPEGSACPSLCYARRIFTRAAKGPMYAQLDKRAAVLAKTGEPTEGRKCVRQSAPSLSNVEASV